MTALTLFLVYWLIGLGLLHQRSPAAFVGADLPKTILLIALRSLSWPLWIGRAL